LRSAAAASQAALAMMPHATAARTAARVSPALLAAVWKSAPISRIRIGAFADVERDDTRGALSLICETLVARLDGGTNGRTKLSAAGGAVNK
jgi:hypothetical protein